MPGRKRHSAEMASGVACSEAVLNGTGISSDVELIDPMSNCP